MRGSIQTKLGAAFGAALVVLGTVTYLMYRTAEHVVHDNRQIAHTFKVLVAIDQLHVATLAAEAAQRSYLITGDPSELHAFSEAETQVVRRAGALKALTVDNAEQQRRVGLLEAALTPLIASMNKAIEERIDEGPEAARRNVGSGRGEALIGELRTLLAEMTSSENALLAHRFAQARASSRLALLTSSLLVAFALALLGSVYLLVRRDITARARAGEDLRRSEERFDLAVRGSRDGIWDWDITTNTVYYSPRWKTQLGYEEGEVGPRFEEWESRLHPDDRERTLTAVRNYLEGRTLEYDLEHRLRHKDGTYRWIRTRGVALRDPTGKPYRMAGSHTDITARKQAERQLAEQNYLLEEAARSERSAHETLKQAQARMVQTEKLAGLGQMVAGIAHEINNPLSFVTNNVAVLQRDAGEILRLLELLDEAGPLIAREQPDLARRLAALREAADLDYSLANLRGLLDRTREGLRRIQQIVSDLRAFARLDEGEVNEADINAGIESTVSIILGHARKKQVEVKLELGPLPPVTCHAAKINQVVMNLVSNAIDACSTGGRVSVRTRADNGAVRIEVEDDGTGIDASVRDRIFDPFFTTKPIGQGTGLGLSISYAIVHDHGGSIEVRSDPGRGACFVVRLPKRPVRTT
ncbi:MAG: CHASE3 domain-containing protein [Isosphaeraceae bacterium]|nr:CHASE3 domain-containing protein [Isosphaeraceae bacterium]